MPKHYRVTRKDERYFEARVKHWANVLSLGDWRIEVWASTKVTENSAECDMWHNAHGAHIKLRGVFDHKLDAKFLDQLALHEVCHVLLCDLKRLIADRCITDSQADTAEHAVIRRLEKAFLHA